MLHTAKHVANQDPYFALSDHMISSNILTFTLTSSSKIMQIKPSEVKLCCLIGHIITMGVVSLNISLSSGGHPGVIQGYLIPIYHVGNHWSSHITHQSDGTGVPVL